MCWWCLAGGIDALKDCLVSWIVDMAVMGDREFKMIVFSNYRVASDQYIIECVTVLISPD